MQWCNEYLEFSFLYSYISPFKGQSVGQYEINYEVELDYKQSYAPRAFFQENAASKIEVPLKWVV